MNSLNTFSAGLLVKNSTAGLNQPDYHSLTSCQIRKQIDVLPFQPEKNAETGLMTSCFFTLMLCLLTVAPAEHGVVEVLSKFSSDDG